MKELPTFQDVVTVPAWKHHERCFIGWPERRDNWRANAEPAQEAFKAVSIF